MQYHFNSDILGDWEKMPKCVSDPTALKLVSGLISSILKNGLE